jgi:tetratricopeptide (TPR) repeat protein
LIPVVLIFLLFLTAGPVHAQESPALSKAGSLEQELVILEREGKIDRCIEVVRNAIKSDTQKPAYYVRLGYLLLKKEAADEALHAFEEALKISPQSHTAKTGKGIALARKGELKSAEAVLTDALILNPDPIRTHYELGLLYEQTGEPDKALKQYKAGIDKYGRGRK